jgi:hypothetical protein
MGEFSMENADWIVLASFTGLVWSTTGLNSPVLVSIEQRFAQVARHRWLSLAAIGGATILLRVALLPWLPVPQPKIHDEFSYLLAADTFAHGRLANPPHPLWIFFDTFHVIQHPTYASIYPPAQGAVLAVGKLMGNPWIGVVFSTAAMCVAMTWMLQAWMPAGWALVGGTLVLLRFGIFSYWMNSYWGGSVSATGAALVMGALPGILKTRRLRDVLVFGAGVTILATSRPLEGFIFCAPIVVAIFWSCLRGTTPAQTVTKRRVLLSLAPIFACLFGFIAYYNWRVTKKPLVFPHLIEAREYLTTPVFLWERAKPPLRYVNQQFEDFYNGWMPSLYHPSWTGVKITTQKNAMQFWEFFLGPALSIPFLTLPWLLRDRKMRLPLVQFGLSSIGLLAVVWFNPHYAGPLLASLVLLVVQALRHLRIWRYRLRPIGVELVRLIVLFSVLIGPASFLIVRSHALFRFWISSIGSSPPLYTLALLAVLLALIPLRLRNNGTGKPGARETTELASMEFLFMILFVFQVCIAQSIIHPRDFPQNTGDLFSPRTSIERRFMSLPGKHLVLVQYSPSHNVHQEFVYNEADIDHSKTIWAREIPGQDLSPLLAYFRKRDVWVLEPDEHPERLYPYSPPQPVP